MLAYLVTYNSSVTIVYNEVITDIQWKLHVLYSEECFIQERQEIIADINVSIYVPILKFSYLSREIKNS